MSDYHSYAPADGHQLAHNPLKALISPRPICWVSTVSAEGIFNLAPYSFFNVFAETPPLLGFSSSGRKDSLSNIEATGEFVHNVVSRSLIEQMNKTSAALPATQSEFNFAELPTLPSDLVAAPRVAAAPAAFECKLVEVKQLNAADGSLLENYLVIGEVVRVHIDSQYISDGLIDENKLQAAARLGYFNYASVDDVFSLPRPKL